MDALKRSTLNCLALAVFVLDAGCGNFSGKTSRNSVRQDNALPTQGASAQIEMQRRFADRFPANAERFSARESQFGLTGDSMVNTDHTRLNRLNGPFVQLRREAGADTIFLTVFQSGAVELFLYKGPRAGYQTVDGFYAVCGSYIPAGANFDLPVLDCIPVDQSGEAQLTYSDGSVLGSDQELLRWPNGETMCTAARDACYSDNGTPILAAANSGTLLFPQNDQFSSEESKTIRYQGGSPLKSTDVWHYPSGQLMFSGGSGAAVENPPDFVPDPAAHGYINFYKAYDSTKHVFVERTQVRSQFAVAQEVGADMYVAWFRSATGVFVEYPPNPRMFTVNPDDSGALNLNWKSSGRSTMSFRLAVIEGSVPPANCAEGRDIGLVETLKLSDLAPQTGYAIRLCAVNGDAMSEGKVAVVTTKGKPLLSTAKFSVQLKSEWRSDCTTMETTTGSTPSTGGWSEWSKPQVTSSWNGAPWACLSARTYASLAGANLELALKSDWLGTCTINSVSTKETTVDGAWTPWSDSVVTSEWNGGPFSCLKAKLRATGGNAGQGLSCKLTLAPSYGADCATGSATTTFDGSSQRSISAGKLVTGEWNAAPWACADFTLTCAGPGTAGGPDPIPTPPNEPISSPLPTSTPAAAPAGFDVDKDEQSVAPGFANPFNYSYAVPIGWGYMDPMVVVHGSDAYTPMLYPCSGGETYKHLYCVAMQKNGVGWAGSVSLGDLYIPGGFGVIGAYQPPMFFLNGDHIIMTHVAVLSSGGSFYSVIGMTSLDTKASVGSWTPLGYYLSSANEIFGYMGGAMGPNKEIILAAWNHRAGVAENLEVFQLNPFYSAVSARYTAVSLSNPGAVSNLTPLYNHVAVEKSGAINIMTTFTNGQSCPETGATYTNYKWVASIRAPSIGGPYTIPWTDKPADVLNDPSTLGHSCVHRSGRFGLDSLADRENDHVYQLFRQSDIISPGFTNSIAANSHFTQSFPLMRNGVKIVQDLGVKFAPLFANNEAIDAMSMTKLSNGNFVIVANNRYGTKTFGLVTTKDFETFSAPSVVSTLYGPGHSIKLAQPWKNGMDSLPSKLFLYHSGDLNNLDNLNHYLRFRFMALTPKN